MNVFVKLFLVQRVECRVIFVCVYSSKSELKNKVEGKKSHLEAKVKNLNFKVRINLEAKSILLHNIQTYQNQLYISRITFDSPKIKVEHS